jgi:serine/threonine protein kinase
VHAPPGMFEPLRDGDPEQVGTYRLHARLGSGGMGEVFLSLSDPGRPVAVKVVRRDYAGDAQFRARFVREIRSARRVSGPRVAQLLDADPYADTPWLATAYVPGPTLAEAVELYGALPVSSVIVLIAGIAEALDTIHTAGLVHRDLKPANVVLGADGLRVIDFGIARAADATALTVTGNLVGSPQYLAPEQILGDPAAPAGDVFSLGALAHYAATGRPAFGEGPKVGVVYRVVNFEPDLAGCPLQLKALIASCLAKEPAARPTTAELAETCEPDEPPLTAADWLPPPVVFAIDSYVEALKALAADLPPASPAPKASARRRFPGPGGLSGPDQPSVPGRDRVHRRSRRIAVRIAAALAVIGAGTGAAFGIATVNHPAASAQQPPAATDSAAGLGGLPAGAAPAALPPGARPPRPGGVPTGSAPPGAFPAPLPPPTVVTWSGAIRITGAGLWLDGVPPSTAQGTLGGDIREAQPAPNAELSSSSPGVTNLALWTKPGTPTGAQCWNLATETGVSQLSVTVGATVCALTAATQAAVLKIESIPSDSSGVTASATVWGRPS